MHSLDSTHFFCRLHHKKIQKLLLIHLKYSIFVSSMNKKLI